MAGSYWLEEPWHGLPPAHPLGRVDVAIVGGGVTGCAAALRLAEGGLQVRVHEAHEVGSGASGRNGGFVLRGGALRYDHAREAYGAEAARGLWRWTETGIDRLEQLAGDAFRRCGGVRIALDAEEREAIRAEYEALRVDGFAAEWHDEPQGIFHGAIVNPTDGAHIPARFARRLALAAAGAGVEIRERSRISSLDELDAERILIATDGYGRGLRPELDRVLRPVRNQVLLTVPLAERPYPRPHYGRQGHAYWQQLEDGRLLLGGFRDVAVAEEATDEEATTPAVQSALDGFLRELLPGPVPVERRWSGIFGATDDLLPLAGPLPHQERLWVAAGYSGHGNVLSLQCGELVADALLGTRDEERLALLDPARLLRRRSA